MTELEFHPLAKVMGQGARVPIFGPVLRGASQSRWWWTPRADASIGGGVPPHGGYGGGTHTPDGRAMGGRWKAIITAS